MYIIKRLGFIPSLMLAVMLCLNSCAKENYNFCPHYPVAGKSVATELDSLLAADYPAFWEWLSRIDKLRQELELCQSSQGE